MSYSLMRQASDHIDFINLNNPLTAIVDGEFPASGAYVDIGLPNAPRYLSFIIRVLALTEAAPIVLQVKQATAIAGTPKNVTLAVISIPSTAVLDDQFIINLDTTLLDTEGNYRFLTLGVSGATAGDENFAMTLLSYDACSLPVTQTNNTEVVNAVVGQP